MALSSGTHDNPEREAKPDAIGVDACRARPARPKGRQIQSTTDRWVRGGFLRRRAAPAGGDRGRLDDRIATRLEEKPVGGGPEHEHTSLDELVSGDVDLDRLAAHDALAAQRADEPPDEPHPQNFFQRA